MNLRRCASSAVLKALGLVGRRRLPPQPDFRPTRIAVMRFGGFGDVLAVTGLTRALREDYPDAEIDFYTDPPSTIVLENNPDIDRVIAASKPRLSASPATIWRNVALVQRWSKPPYDLAIVAHHEFDLLVLSLFFRARFVVGYDINERGFDFAFTHSSGTFTGAHPRTPEHLSSHFTVHIQRLLHAFQGRERDIAEPRIAVSDAESAKADAFLADHGLGGELLVVAPGGSTPTKLWPMERFAAVTRKAIERHGVSAMVMLGPSEADAKRYFMDMPGRFHFDAGGNSFRENIALVGKADAVVGNDTGLMHAAAAFGVPGVAVFGPTSASVFGYGHRGHRILTGALPCIPCDAPFCKLLADGGISETAPCMDEISAERVVAELDSLLGRREGAA